MSVLQRFEWAGVLMGPVVYPTLYPDGATPIGDARYIHVALAVLLPLGSLLLAFVLGGLAAGGVVATFPGKSSALGATLTAFGGLAWFAGPSLWEPNRGHNEVYVLNEGPGALISVGAAFCVLLPFVVVAGYVGGRVGGSLRNGLRRRGAGRYGE